MNVRPRRSSGNPDKLRLVPEAALLQIRNPLSRACGYSPRLVGPKAVTQRAITISLLTTSYVGKQQRR
jgi:hypothetical protein